MVGTVIIVVLTVLGVLAWYFFLRSPSRPSTQPAAPVNPPAETLPRPFSGSDGQETTSFSLAGGDYVVDWTARDTDDDSVSCLAYFDLEQDGGSYSRDVASADPDDGQTQRGTANLHDVPSGRYYFDANTNCAWTLAIRR